MSHIEQIKAEQKKLADELEGEMLKERANVLAKMKEDIKLSKDSSPRSATTIQRLMCPKRVSTFLSVGSKVGDSAWLPSKTSW